MAYSMNWRPQLDEISETDKPAAPSTSRLGPIPGLLPPSRNAPHNNASSSTRSNGTQFSNSYNMNWRPKYDDEEDEEEQSKPMPASAVLASASSRARGVNLEKQNDSRTFRVSLSADCPLVDCLGLYAFACVNDGVVCTLEEGSGVPSIGIPSKWTMHVHPATAKLSHRHITQLSQAIYCCLYAALIKSGEDAIRLKLLDAPALGPSAQKAILNLGIPLDLSLPITPSFLLQLYQYAEPRLLTPAFPFFQIQSFNGSRKPIAHPARPPSSQAPPESLYSRYDRALQDHCQLYVQTAARGSEWITLLPSTTSEHSTSQSGATQSVQVQLSWALEDPALETMATSIQDYDRAVHLEGFDNTSWQQIIPYLSSICHYAFLTERRSVKLWATCTIEADTKLLVAHGWKPIDAKTETKGQIHVVYLAQNDFWTNIKSL